ncbi:MAG: hypothetical protein JXQ96_08390 [Cyclobacteriaceae bacterium]
MWKKALTLRWIGYHLLTLARFLYLYQPFRLQNRFAPVRFTPGGAWPVFIFSGVCCLLIFGPILIFILSITSSGIVVPELFIVSVFGFVFSIFFRSAQSKSASHIYFDGQDIFFTIFGFYEEHVEVIDKNDVRGLQSIKQNLKGTHNYKICLLLDDNRLLLIRLTISAGKAKHLLTKYSELFDTEMIDIKGDAQIINDSGIVFQ